MKPSLDTLRQLLQPHILSECTRSYGVYGLLLRTTRSSALFIRDMYCQDAGTMHSLKIALFYIQVQPCGLNRSASRTRTPVQYLAFATSHHSVSGTDFRSISRPSCSSTQQCEQCKQILGQSKSSFHRVDSLRPRRICSLLPTIPTVQHVFIEIFCSVLLHQCQLSGIRFSNQGTINPAGLVTAGSNMPRRHG